MAEVVIYRQRKVVSLVMLLLGLGLGFMAYVLVHLNQYDAMPGNWPIVLGMWLALGLTSWGVVQWRLPYADPLLLPSVFLLNGIGIAIIYRLDQATNPPMQSGRLQLIWTVISVMALCLVVILLRDHRRLQRYTYVWFVAGLILLLMPLMPILGTENHGARIWVRLGPLSFQPAEIAKIVLSIAFAAYLTEKRDVLATAGRRFLGIDLPRARDLGPILIMWVASLLVLVFQKDLGTTVLFFGLFVMMIYIATERRSWVILGAFMVLVMGVLGYLAFGHVQTRFQSWLNPFADFDRNLQVINAQFGMAWGGLFGTGLGMGRPYLTPLSKNDFIAAAIGEELGLFGLFAVMMVFLIIVARVLRASLAAREPFGKLLAAGLAFVFALQVFVILGGVTRLLPLTGLTTPFVSQGGSSLVSNYILLGLMLTITHQVRRPHVEAPVEDFSSFASDATTAIAAVGSAPRPAPEDFNVVGAIETSSPTSAVAVDDETVTVPRRSVTEDDATVPRHVGREGVPDDATIPRRSIDEGEH